jgi:hypothetical protein
MRMQDRTEEELGLLFDRAGIPRRLLCPFWCRALRKLGVPCRSPVTFGFLDHVRFGAIGVLVLMGTVGATLWWLDLIPGRGLALITGSLLVVNPVLSALRYRGIRTRLERIDAAA